MLSEAKHLGRDPLLPASPSGEYVHAGVLSGSSTQSVGDRMTIRDFWKRGIDEWSGGSREFSSGAVTESWIRFIVNKLGFL